MRCIVALGAITSILAFGTSERPRYGPLLADLSEEKTKQWIKSINSDWVHSLGQSFRRRSSHLCLSNLSENEFQDDLNSRAGAIKVENERERLEEANKQAFLKRMPRKLPYEDARRWIQANLGASSKEEFYDLVENGNLRTPYIPKRPEEYYTKTREWISWEHFLTGIFDNKNPSAVRPKTGIFDWWNTMWEV